jgi:hypothetical protein
MATLQFTYAQVSNGFNGLVDKLADATRVFAGSRRGGWSGKITGTEAKMLGKDNDNLFWVSIDGGAFVNSVNASGVHTLFTGESDTEHSVRVTMGSPFGFTNGWWVINQSYLLEVTGAAPAFSTLEHSWSAHSPDLVSSAATVMTSADAPITYRPEIRRNFTYDNAATSKVRFSTEATEILITLNFRADTDVALYYSVDGAAYIRVEPLPSNEFRLTGLSGLHSYNIMAGGPTNNNTQDADVASVMANAPLIKTGGRLDQFGDSISHAGGANVTIEIHEVASYFGKLGQTYAISGWTVNDLLVNIPLFNLPNLIEAGDIAINTIGRNSLDIDTNNTVRDEYIQIIDELLAVGYSRVLCRGMIPEAGSPMTAQSNAISAIVDAYNDPRVAFIDVSSWTGVSTHDGVHPDPTGYQELTVLAKNTYEPLFTNQPDIVIHIDINDTSVTMLDGVYGTVLKNNLTKEIVFNGDVSYVNGLATIVLNDGVSLTNIITGFITTNEDSPLKGSWIKSSAVEQE